MIYKIFTYKKVNSTNDIAIKKIKKGFSRGLIRAEFQKKGRGQHGKKWISCNGNLFVSIFFKINKKITLKMLTFKNCNKIKKVISKLINKNLTIKWPNDLLLNKKKICGILQETTTYNNSLFMVLGIGINLIKSPKIINYSTTNILDEIGINVSKKIIIKNIINEFKYN
jgi:BirA family biotin operon repressor/biotin-[acetyl-CoA-carboxylase] ligase